MKVIGINGSPRRNWNTATLVRDALEGAAETGAETELYNLYDLDFKGCTSCFSCKRIGLEEHRCAMRDGLTQVLDAVTGADAVIIGSPIYFNGLSAMTDAFLERLFFPYVTYGNGPTFCPRAIPSAFIYTMNITEEQLDHYGIDINRFRRFTKRVLGRQPEELYCYNTWQYQDYDRYEHQIFDMESKRIQREQVFPKDREAARELGRRMAGQAEPSL